MKVSIVSKVTRPKTKSIWLVTIGEPLPVEPKSRQMRARILANRLAARGYEVTWWTSNFNHFKKEYYTQLNGKTLAGELSTAEGYKLRFLHGCIYKKNLSIARQINHWQIARDFKRQAKSLDAPSLVICSFPPIELSHAVISFCKRNSVPSIVDVRDLWPDELLARIPQQLRRLGAIALWPLRFLVRRTFADVTAIVGVSKTYLNWGISYSRGALDVCGKLLPLGYPDTSYAQKIRHERVHKKTRDGLHFLFTGSFNNSVDLDTLIHAFRRYPDPKAKLTICGTGERELQLRNLARTDERIRFTGWIGGGEIAEIARTADIGVVCYRPESLVAMPNKLFEYTSFGMPVINSIVGEACDIVTENRIGWNYSAGDPDDLLAVMLNISEEMMRVAKSNAIFAYENYYSDTIIYDEYLDLIDKIVNVRKLA